MKKTTMMATTMVAMAFLFLPFRNVSAAEKASDLCTVETVEDYLENRIDSEVKIKFGKSIFRTEIELDGGVVGTWHDMSVDEPVISKKDGKYRVYGTDTYSRQLEEIYEAGSGVEYRICEGMYVDLPEDVEYIGNSKYCTFGKYKDSTRYALFREGKQLTSFDVGEKLEFPRFGFGIARGVKSKKAYMLRFTTKKVEVESVAEGGVEEVYQWNDRLDTSPGLCFFKTEDGKYYVRPSSKEYMDLGQIPEAEYTLWEVIENKEKNPGYVVEEDSFENYDYVRVTYGGDATVFKREYIIRVGWFEYARYEKSPIERGYLVVAANRKDDDFKSITELCYEYLKLDDLESREKEINELLAEYEETHVESIKAEIEELDLAGQQWGSQINEEVKKFLNKYNN